MNQSRSKNKDLLGHLGQPGPPPAWSPPSWADPKSTQPAQTAQPNAPEPPATRGESLVMILASVPTDWKKFRGEVDLLTADGATEPDAARTAYEARYGIDPGPIDLNRLSWLWDDQTKHKAPRRPWRESLASWPDEWRAKWGRRANDLEQDGLPLDEAERQAFGEIAGHKRLAKD